MNFDISHLLSQWDYKPGQVGVRRFIGKDGVEKIQLRVDLGVLQMNAHGRPDGKRPHGFATQLDYYLHQLSEHLATYSDMDKPFALQAEDCSLLQLEALQYHHRYICLLQLQDYGGVIADSNRNLQLFDFVEKYAESEDLSLSLRQFRPQVLMIHARARAGQCLQAKNFVGAVEQIRKGIERLQFFFQNQGRPELAEQSSEIHSLQQWLEEIERKRPRSRREKLEMALHDAVQREDYEKAARVRDALRNLEASE